eukprot:9060526-Lingulodinium_polyedra.AAC.1
MQHGEQRHQTTRHTRTRGDGPMAQWKHGTMKRREQWKQQSKGTMEQQNNGTVEQWINGTIGE